MRHDYFVSFDPETRAEENVPPFSPLEDSRLVTLIGGAMGVILPVYLTPARYESITRHAADWFPRLESRYLYRGKCSQIRLFRKLGVRHPQSLLFHSPSAVVEYVRLGDLSWSYPLVLKGDSGGGGISVFPVHDFNNLQKYVVRLKENEPALLQQWVHHGGRDLRVVVYGDDALSYFRVGDGSFYNNVCRGGRLDHHSDPAIREKGCRTVLDFCCRANIHVAGFDLMFPDQGPPVFVEINFHFGRKGLGGSREHRNHMRKAIEQWKSKVKNGLDKVPTPPTNSAMFSHAGVRRIT